MLDLAYGLIFGGCCANVFALEAIVKHEPDSGLLITVTQFALVTLFALPTQLEPSPKSWLPRLKRTAVPVSNLAVMAFLFFTVNMMNNWAFAFDISVPMHIILRSFGSVQTLAVGWLWGKKYSSLQVIAVLFLTIGVVLSAWADAQAKGAKMDVLPASLSSKSDSTAGEAPAAASSYLAGLILLFTAQLLSAFMGIYTETIYTTHGRHWRENLFYSHLLGLAFSLTLLPTLQSQAARMLAGPRVALPRAVTAGLAVRVPKRVLLLGLNALTQVVCISGVNRLSANTSAVTVTVVLNVRKLVSFLLSCAVYDNPLSTLMAVGAAVVFASGGLYGYASVSKGKQAEPKGDADEKGKANGAAGASTSAEVKSPPRARKRA